MDITIITFSPTGGTEKVADIIASSMGKVGKTIDLTKRYLPHTSLSPDDTVIIAVPSYSGRVPALAVERLKYVSGNDAKAILVVVYGNRAYEDTLVELEDVTKGQGFKIVAAISAVAKHSIASTIAVCRPDEKDQKLLNEFGIKIAEKLAKGIDAAPAIPGNRPFRKEGNGPVPETSGNCNLCETCARECPSGAISMDNPKIVDSNICIGCMRCVEICPENAKSLSPIVFQQISQMLEKLCATRKEPELFV